MHFEPWQWALLVAGALAAGFSKTGIPGLGILFVAVFAIVLPARQATGVVLPLLILGDVFAVVVYRRHAQWRHLWRLLPATLAGIVVGWWVLRKADDAQTARLVGVLLVAMLAVHGWRRFRARTDPAAPAPSARVFAVASGLFAGFSTQVANAAGPVMTLYLLAMRLPKLEFVGTGAVFFMLVNWVKVPFMVQLGLINHDSLLLNLWLAPAVMVGALLGRVALPRINTATFEAVALVLAILAVAKLLFW
ncbi:MAG TPA: sulfite exporter TauE/SafE family protein [Lacunisphaera sp.]|nr:sulfite exporter TauE/SafE family protein [Lacunisphaera sp.]